MIVLTAYVVLQPDKVEPALKACQTVKRHSLTEDGCERYDFFQSLDDPTRIVFVEEWSSKPHLDTHFQQAAFQAFFAELGGYIQGPPEIRIFESSRLT